MKIFVTYQDDKMSTIEIDDEIGLIFFEGYGLTPRLSSMLKDLAICLVDFHEEMRKENKC